MRLSRAPLRTPNTGSGRAHSLGPWRRISPGSRRAKGQERSFEGPLSIFLLKQKGEECGRNLRTTPSLLSGNFPGGDGLTDAHPVPPQSRHLDWSTAKWGTWSVSGEGLGEVMKCLQRGTVVFPHFLPCGTRAPRGIRPLVHGWKRAKAPLDVLVYVTVPQSTT